jgi:hypothetical protein
MDLVLDPRRSRLLLAPLAAYPVEGRPYPLPFELTDEAEAYAGAVLDGVAPDAEVMVLLTTEAARTYDVWLAERSRPLGFAAREVGEFGGVRLVLFERTDTG